MSLNVPKVNVVSVRDPRLDIDFQKDYVALKGSLVNSCQQFSATNFSSSSCQITCNPPSRNIAISRLVFKRMTFTVTITGTNTSGGPLLVQNYYAPRFMPLASVTTAEQITINNATITQAPMSQYAPTIWGWYQNDYHNRFGQYSLFPSMLDQAQAYSDTAQTARNPLSKYSDQALDNSRGGYSGMVVTSNPNSGTTAVLTLTVTEPILLSPLVAGDMSNFTAAFCGVQNMAYNCTFGNFARLMSIQQDQGTGAGGSINITGVTATLTGASLLFNYFTPDPINPIPRSMETSFFSLVSYPSQYQQGNVNPGNPCSIPMQSIQVSSIPRRMYIFSRIDDSLQTAFTSDAYLGLPETVNPLTVTWNNNQFFAQYTSQDLYNMSVKNGLQMSWSQFNKHTGGIICIDFGTDLGLMSDEAPGTLGNYQLGLQCQFVNRSNVAFTPTMYVVVVYEGVFNIVDGNCSQMIGVLSREDVLNARPNDNITYANSKDVFGGNFFSKIRSAFGKVNDFVKKNQLISKGLALIPDPRAQAVGQAAATFGYGTSGGRRAPRRRRGGDLNLSALQQDSDNGSDQE